MHQLNFPKFDFRVKTTQNQLWIFDIIRKKFVVLGPEEWVRQHVLHYLIFIKKYPKSLITVEKQLLVNSLKKRCDLIVYDNTGQLTILVECKAPEIRITQQTFDQIARYNAAAKAQYLMVTNGLSHYYCIMDQEEEKYQFLNDIPDFSR